MAGAEQAGAIGRADEVHGEEGAAGTDGPLGADQLDLDREQESQGFITGLEQDQHGVQHAADCQQILRVDALLGFIIL